MDGPVGGSEVCGREVCGREVCGREVCGRDSGWSDRLLLALTTMLEDGTSDFRLRRTITVCELVMCVAVCALVVCALVVCALVVVEEEVGGVGAFENDGGVGAFEIDEEEDILLDFVFHFEAPL